MKLIILSILCLFVLQASCRSHHRSHHHLHATPAATLAPLSTVTWTMDDQGLLEFNTFLPIMQKYNLTQGESRSIFRLCDLNRDDRLSANEWDTCNKVFVVPYETYCLKGKDYMLASADIAGCVNNANIKVFTAVPTTPPAGQKIEDAFIDILGRTSDKKLNFADYIYIRRLAFAWQECSVDNRIAKRRMECALSATTALKRKFLPVSNQVFNVAIQLYKTYVKENEAFLDFFSYAKIAYVYYYFNEFELPFQEEYIMKKAMLKGIEDQNLPTSVTVEMVNNIYYAIDPDNNGFKGKLDFAGYATIMNLYKIYSKTAVAKNNKLTFTEANFETILKDPQWSQFIGPILSAIVVVSDGDYANFTTDPSIVPGFDDREYFTRFVETHNDYYAEETADASSFRSTAETTAETYADANAALYKSIFNMFDLQFTQNWNFTTLVNWAKLTYAFQNIDIDQDGLIINDDINLYLMGKIFMIPLSTADLYRFQTISETIGSEQINIREFYPFFNYKQIFKYKKILNTESDVSLTNFNKCLIQLGLRLSNVSIAYSKEFLALSKLPGYNYEKGFRRVMKEDIMVTKVVKMLGQDRNATKDANVLSTNQANYKTYYDSQMRGEITWNNQP